VLDAEIYRAPCPEPGCNDGTGQAYGTKMNFTAPEDAASNLGRHWGDAHAAAHVLRSTIPADFR
jgi:hypothetical protein